MQNRQTTKCRVIQVSHCKDHNQWLTVIHLQGDHAGMQQYAEKSFEETLLRFWLWDYLRWGVSKVGSVRIVWLTFLTCSWAFCYSFYGVMKIYHVTSFTCTCLACLRVRIWWIVCENWRVKWCRFVADMYRFQGLKRWNYNKRVAVSYKDDLSDWTVANYKFRNSRPVTEKLEES